MDKETLLHKVEDYVRDCMEETEPGHDYLHILRVRKMALRLGTTADCDILLVELLALLHDIEDPKLNKGYSVRCALESFDMDASLRESILQILPYLSFSKYPVLPDDFPIEGKIVSDADRLDAIGAIGVARAFSYGGSKNRRMYGRDQSTINHFDEKLLRLDKYLYLEESKRIAKSRMEFLRAFYDEFLSEIGER